MTQPTQKQIKKKNAEIKRLRAELKLANKRIKTFDAWFELLKKRIDAGYPISYLPRLKERSGN